MGSIVILLGIRTLYDEYRQDIFYNDERKALCRQLLLSYGTEQALRVARRTHESSNKFSQCWEYLFTDVLADIMTCPREIVRYFHRNNSCDCLKELYYTLKTTTTRTTHCIVCNCVKEIQQMKQCSKCKRAQYCSQECARAHHQDHKYLCKHWRALQEVDQELSFGMGYLNF